VTIPSTPQGTDLGIIGTAANAVTVASYDNYAAAQRAVDFLSDEKFPVEHTAIVGSDLLLVEKVTGRLTVARAALAGASAGAWFGLLAGVLFSLFTRGGALNWIAMVVVAVVVFALWGAVFGAVAHATTGGRRDFASRSGIVASRYEVRVTAEHAPEASRRLLRLT
jgi:hypothetical protein